MAFGSVSDILLRITGDPNDATDAIAEIAGELAVFSKQSAEAEAEVLTDKAQAKLRELRAQLEALDLSEATPEVRAKVAQAMVELQLVESEMNDIDGRELNVDVDVRRGVLERLNAASNSVLGLTGRVRGLSGASEGLFSNLSDVGLIMGPFAARIGTIGQVVAILSPLIVSLGGALVALAGSLGAAAAGLGALGIAAGGVFAAGIGLAFAAIARFKEQSDIAGTPANALKTAFQGIGDAAKALLPAVDPVLRAMAQGLTALKPLIGFLAPAFKSFGSAAAGALQTFFDALSSPAIASGISQLLQLAGGALQPIASIAASLFRIFLNIAQAAMPALNVALSLAAGWFDRIADSTDDISGLRGSINGLVGVLGTWLQLLGAIADVLFSVLSASAGPGTELVKWLTEGAQSLADWVKSSEGQDRIKQFFDDTLPLVKQLVEMVGRLIVIFIEVGQILAPVLEPVVAAINPILEAVEKLLALWLSVPAPVRNAVAAIVGILVALFTGVGEVTAAVLLVVGAINLIVLAVRALGPLWSAMGAVAAAAFSAIGAAVGAVVGVIGGAAGGIGAAARAIGSAIVAGINIAAGIGGRVAGFVSGVIGKVSGAIGAVSSAAASIGRGIVRGIQQAASIAQRVATFINGARDKVTGAVATFVSAAISIGRGIVRGVAQGAADLARTVFDKLHAAITGIRSFIGDFFNVGKAIIEAMVNGVKAAAGGLANAAADAVKGALDKAKGLLPGSEPKDPSSPMRNLKASGEAIILNTVRGIEAAGPAIADALRGSLVVPRVPSFSLAAGLQAAAFPDTGGTPGTGRGDMTINNTILAPAGEQPDPGATLALMSMKLRTAGVL